MFVTFFLGEETLPTVQKEDTGKGMGGAFHMQAGSAQAPGSAPAPPPPATTKPLTVSPGVLSSISDPQLSGLHQLAPARVTVTYTSSKLRLALPSEILKVPPHRHPTQLSCVCPAWRISQKQRHAYPGSRCKSQKDNKPRQDTSPAQICAAVSDSTGHFPQQSPSKPPV